MEVKETNLATFSDDVIFCCRNTLKRLQEYVQRVKWKLWVVSEDPLWNN